MEEKVRKKKIQKLKEMIEDRNLMKQSNMFLSSFVREAVFRWILAESIISI